MANQLTIEFTDETASRLEVLRQDAGHDSPEETVQHALAIYEVIVRNNGPVWLYPPGCKISGLPIPGVARLMWRGEPEEDNDGG